MCTKESISTIKEALKSLCSINGWSYGVFWRFDQRNSLLLTMQEAYYEEQMGGVIDDMLLQVHMLGGGIIGQAAFTKKHRWMFSDSHFSIQNSVGSSEDIFQDDSEFHRQFSSSIKTIAVISVEPGGVVQFGSTHKILEGAEFVDQTKRVFKEMENVFPENVPPSSNSEIYAPSGLLFDSLISPENSRFSDFRSINVGETTGLSTNPISRFDPISAETPSTGTWSNVESTLCTFDELIQAVDYSTVDNDLFSQPMDLYSVHSSLNEHDIDTPMNVPVNCPANSLQSSITSSFNEKCPNNTRVENRPLDNRVDFGEWDDILMSVMNGGPEQNVGPRNGLFSKLGIEALLDGLSGTSNAGFGSGFEDRLSFTAKRRRIDSSFLGGCSDELAGFPCFAGTTMDSLKYVHTVGMTNNVGLKPEAVDKYSVNVGPAKTKKRKAKPGTRPRPKDRQMIQDRFSELRQLIPNGEKMNIDCLLDRTIKHMLFLQSVTIHADRVKQADKPKGNNTGKSGGGVTWACELGDQTMVCPLIVEDLSSPGQMLIEMLCEEQGFFLEIVDIIQGFGLNILKGLMEVHESKIWARFIVDAEGKRHVARHEIFSALLQLIQMKAPNANAVDLSDQVGINVIDERANNLLNHNNYQQSVGPLPVSLAETLGYVNL